MEFGFVVLHYNAVNSTIDCINSVKEAFKGNEIKVCVVDNCSPDASGRLLIERFCEDEAVKVILNEQNMGFAKGMNVGIEYLRSNYSCDFVFLLNNDVEFVGDNWPLLTLSKFEQYSFAVMGPDIVNLDGTHCNPAAKQIEDIADVHKLIAVKNKKLRLYRANIEPFYTMIRCSVKSFIKKIIGYKPKTDERYKHEAADVQLQGSCLILSSIFFENYDCLFNGTFLYFEEAILKYMCDKKKLVSLYCPEIKLKHKEGIATKTLVKNKKKKDIFYLKNSLNSCRAFLEWVGKEA